jgi:hypothetical protein
VKLSESQLRKLVKGTLAEIGVATDSSSPIDQVEIRFDQLKSLVHHHMKRDPGGRQQIYRFIDDLKKQIVDNLGVYDSGDV